MHSQEGKWVHSRNEEVFYAGGYYDTIEEAIEAGRVEYSWDGKQDTFYVGQVQSVDFAITVDVDGVFEHVAQNVYDEVGEVADGYLYKVDRAHQEALQEAMDEVLIGWMKHYGYMPTFFKVVNIQRIEETNSDNIYKGTQ